LAVFNYFKILFIILFSRTEERRREEEGTKDNNRIR